MRKRGASAGFSMRHDLLRRSSLLDDVDAAPSFVLSLSYFAVFFGESLWRTTFANYVIQDLGIGAERLPFFFAMRPCPAPSHLPSASPQSGLEFTYWQLFRP